MDQDTYPADHTFVASLRRGEADARSAAGEGRERSERALRFETATMTTVDCRARAKRTGPRDAAATAIGGTKPRLSPLPGGERPTRAARRVRGASAASVLFASKPRP